MPERLDRPQAAAEAFGEQSGNEALGQGTAGRGAATPGPGGAAASLAEGTDSLPAGPAAPSGPAKPRRPAADSGGFSLGMGRPLDQEEMDLTPMVDMTFLLLIFFMITASFSVQKSMQVPPPTSDKKGAAQEIQSIDDIAESSITVRIDDRNVIFIEDEPLPGTQRLSDALLQKFNAQRNELLLSADEGALHDTVIAVIDAANEIGVQKIRMVAASKD
jgi:biopolymer transport protein ExbD